MIDVCLAYIFNDKGEVLLAKRAKEKHFGGLWEFAGGKVKDNENIVQAITRELQEELRVDVTVKKIFAPYTSELDDGSILQFHPCHCKIVDGELNATEHEALEFVALDRLELYELAPPDYEAVTVLIRYMDD